jgi:TIR domain-containing protein/F5/8 type C domain-containing protein
VKRTAFISHSSKDKAIGETVCNFLERNGIPCWIAPRNVMPGKNYGVAIVDAIDECGVFILILSAESNKSGQVVREVERAASGDAVIIPVRVEAVQPSRDLEFYVSSSHWLDATEKPLEKHLDALVDAIRKWQSKHEPQEGAPAERLSPTPSPTSRRSNLPFLIGGAVVAIAIIGLAIFLANRPRTTSTPQTPKVTAASPGAQANPPRMGMGRRRPGREQASTGPGVPNTPASINETASSPVPNEAASLGPNENLPPGPPPVIDHVTASSVRPPVMYMGAMRHFEAEKAFDGNDKTAWIPVGSGPGEWIEVFFKSPTTISSISIFGGSGADAARNKMNNRVQQIRVTFPNGFTRLLTLADKMELQNFNFPRHPVVPSIKFEIVSVYRGDQNDATPIAEIEFNRPE